jgi:thiamine kinase-like enzyme
MRFNRIFKIVISTPGMKQLDREVRNSQLALEWDIYSGRVVSLEKVAPFIAAATFINETNSVSYIRKRQKLMELSINRLDSVLKAPKRAASDILINRIHNLDIELEKDHPVYTQFRELVNSNYFRFEIPVTPMHGDFLPGNSLLTEEKLLLIDWEYALKEGSILYDWWYLKFYIDIDKNYNEETKIYFSFIEKALEKINLSYDQFEAFGYAMISSAYISAYELKRIRDLKKCRKYIRELDRIVSGAN